MTPLDWTILLFASTCTLIGARLLLRALFADRSRGRPRCPQCWYDLTGLAAAGITCPECGRSVPTERGLFRTRRHWRRALIILVVTLLTGPGLLVQKVRRDGWASMVPTTVLILGIGPEWRLGVGPVPRAPWHNAMSDELSRRFNEGRLWDWQWQWAIRRSNLVQTRPRVVAGTQAVGAALLPRWLSKNNVRIADSVLGARWGWVFDSSPPDLQYVPIDTITADMRRIAVELQIESIGFTTETGVEKIPTKRWTTTIHFPVHPVARKQDLLDPVSSGAVERALRSRWNFRIDFYLPGVIEREAFAQFEIPGTISGPESRIGIACDLELRRDGAAMETAHAGLFSAPQPWRDAFGDRSRLLIRADLASIKRSMVNDPAEIARWTVRVRGVFDPYMVKMWSLTGYWTGEFTVPLADVLVTPKP